MKLTERALDVLYPVVGTVNVGLGALLLEEGLAVKGAGIVGAGLVALLIQFYHIRSKSKQPGHLGME